MKTEHEITTEHLEKYFKGTDPFEKITEKLTAVQFMEKWNKENNPFYPNEMKWDRNTVYTMLTAYDEQYKNHNL